MTTPTKKPEIKCKKYGVSWPTDDPVAIEFGCIQRGGRWDHRGVEVGNGLFYHYKAVGELLFPDHMDNRWSDLILEQILENKILGVMGPGNAAKTFSVAKYGIIDYWAFPENTCVLVSSTDVRGLELRVWGTIKRHFNEGLARCPWLAGYVVDSKHRITTDKADEKHARVINKGIVCIPCLSGGTFVGLKNYIGIKQQRVRLLADECFPAGTLVDTPSGPVAIETIKPGDQVLSACGMDRVVAVRRSLADHLVEVRAGGKRIVCTPGHPFLTQFGWVEACRLGRWHRILSIHEAMQILREGNEKHHVLFKELRREVRDLRSTEEEAVLHGRKEPQGRHRVEGEVREAAGPQGAIKSAHETLQPDGRSKVSGKDVQDASENWPSSSGPWWKREGSVERRASVPEGIPGSRVQPCGEDPRVSGSAFVLQGGRCFSETHAGGGDRRPVSLLQKGTGSEEGQLPPGAQVESVEVYEQAGLGGHGIRGEKRGVYNLQVERHPSFSVEGFAVHNCQVMGSSFLDALSNLLGNPDFKGVFMGNPVDPMDPLGRACEPKDGWSSHPEPMKTEVWETRFLGGKCVNLVGTDSPNMDVPEDQPVPFPFLLTRQKIKEVVAFWGQDSAEYYSQCKGVMKTGLMARRVITPDLCRQHHALDQPIWKDNQRTLIHALDAAYSGTGGDRCVQGHVEFGLSVEGVMTIAPFEPEIIPISINFHVKPEEQIAIAVKAYLDRYSIKPENSFYDSTGRGTLGSAYAAVFGHRIPNPVEFGGKATQRPVRYDLFVDDGRGGKRLKTCEEHYLDFVTELWFSGRYIIETGQLRRLPQAVMDEGSSREYGRGKANRIFIESKHDPRARSRMHRSPDLFDWFVTAIEGCRQRGFQIRRLGSDLVDDGKKPENWFLEQQKRMNALRKSKSLTYS